MDVPVRIWVTEYDIYIYGLDYEPKDISDPYAEYIRADTVSAIIRERDEAVRREKALLESNDIERKALVEAASLRHQLKQAHARIRELEGK